MIKRSNLKANEKEINQRVILFSVNYSVYIDDLFMSFHLIIATAIFIIVSDLIERKIK